VRAAQQCQNHIYMYVCVSLQGPAAATLWAAREMAEAASLLSLMFDDGTFDDGTAAAASVDVPLDASNKGFALLRKMGWNGESGLGKSGTGIKEPIRATSTLAMAGLGKMTEYIEAAQVNERKGGCSSGAGLRGCPSVEG
jgi:hypothetical protein